MEGLKPGRIVYFVFDASSAEQVNRRLSAQSRDRELAVWNIGNMVYDRDVLPAMVVRVVDIERVNLKVMLDGTDVYWATSVAFSPEKVPGTWHWMFEGQNTRYDATKQQ